MHLQSPPLDWEIVPYVGKSEVKRVRIRDNKRISIILDWIRTFHYVAVLGPPYSEKTRLLSDLQQSLSKDAAFSPIYVNLWQARFDDFFFTSICELLRQTQDKKNGFVPENYEPRSQPLDEREFQNYLSDLRSRYPTHLVLLIDHLDALPPDLVHKLLRALRALHNERSPGSEQRLMVVVAGGLILADQSMGSTSPFNIAKLSVIEALNDEQSHQLVQTTIDSLVLPCTKQAQAQILHFATGDRYLLPQLCTLCHELIQGYRLPKITSSVVNQASERLLTQPEMRKPIDEAIRLLEEDSDSVLDIDQILSMGGATKNQVRQQITRGNVDRLQLSGAVTLQDGIYRVKNELFRHELRRYFSSGHVANILRMTGRWKEAINYLVLHSKNDSLEVDRTNIVEAIIQSIYAVDSVDKAFEQFAQGIQVGFHRPDVAIYQVDSLRHELHLVYPNSQAHKIATTIALDPPDTDEAKTYLDRNYALRRAVGGSRFISALIPDDHPIGVVAIDNFNREQTLDRNGFPQDLHELSRFMRYAAGAINNVIFRSAFQEIGRAVLNVATIDNGLEAVLRSVSNAVGAEAAILYLLDESQQYLTVAADVGHLLDITQPKQRIYLTDSHPAVRCLQQSETTESITPIRATLTAQSVNQQNYVRICVLLTANQSKLGVLETRFTVAHYLRQEHTSKLRAFADQISIAVYNMLLLQRTNHALEQREQELDNLQEISRTLVSTLDTERVLETIVENVKRLFPGCEATIWRYHKADKKLNVVGSTLTNADYRQLDLDLESVAGKAVQTKLPQKLQDLRAEIKGATVDVVGPLNLLSLIDTPLESRGEILGVISLYLESLTQFTPSQEQLLQTIAAQAAITLDYARQFDLLQEAQQRLKESKVRQLQSLIMAVFHRISNAGDVPNRLLGLQALIAPGNETLAKNEIDAIKKRFDNVFGLEPTLRKMVDLTDRKTGFDPVDICKAMHTAIESAACNPGINQTLYRLEQPIFTQGDANLLRDAFQTVIENACEAMNGKGTLTIQIITTKPSATIQISNTGPAISPEQQKKIFNPGYSTKSGSRGIGLFTCRYILNLHGGEITLKESSANQTTFDITIPIFEHLDLQMITKPN